MTSVSANGGISSVRSIKQKGMPIGFTMPPDTPISLSPFDNLAKRLNDAAATKATSFTMSVAEVTSLVAALSSIVAQNAAYVEQIANLQNELIKEKTKISSVVVDTGRF